MIHRPRRLRRSHSLRRLVQETELRPSDLVMPLFVIEGKNHCEPIPSMPGIDRFSSDLILKKCEELLELGVLGVALFPVIPDSKKDSYASASHQNEGLYQTTIRSLKESLPEMIVISDTAMDPYSTDGHDGLLLHQTHPKKDSVEIVNDESLEILAKMAISQAQAGADIIAPSDMMDGRIGFIRAALDQAGFSHIALMSYTVKYASSFYAPFRDALGSAPRLGDKKTYQMNPCNIREAIREAQLDISEGSDMLLVKPGLAYLDVLREIRANSSIPVGAYNVSGEYAMLRAASQSGWLDYQNAVCEVLHSFKRAGADFILSYHAHEAARWLSEE